MSAGKVENVVIGLGVLLAVGAVAYFFLRGAKGAAKDVSKGLVNVGVGSVLGVSEALGIPETNQTECEKALAEGRTWDASFACPAGKFLGSLFTSKPATAAPAPSQPEEFRYYEQDQPGPVYLN